MMIGCRQKFRQGGGRRGGGRRRHGSGRQGRSPQVVYGFFVRIYDMIPDDAAGGDVLHSFYYLLITTAALQPPNPEAVFKQVVNGLDSKVVATFSGVVTPFCSNPLLGKIIPSRMDCRVTMDSMSPAAPSV